MNRKKIHWDAMPFVRMLIPLILGILMYEWLQLRHYLVLSVFLSLSIVYIILVIRRLGVKKKIWYGTLLQMMLLTFGYNLASYQDDIQDVTHFSKQANADFNTILGSVIDVKERLYRYELVVDVERVENDLDNSRTNGLLNAYVNYDDLDIEVKVGQKIFFQSEINNHPLPKNPFVFDYGKFLSRKRIYHSTSNLRNFEVLSHPTDIRFWFHNQREKLLQNLHQKMQSDDNYAIAASILLGYRNDVGRDLKRSFAETGSMHVLAVSGLHVGIIWWIVGMVLGLFRSSSGSAKFIRVATQLLVIWGFAFLTGASPSVLRAAGMFSVISIANLRQGDDSIYHRLAIAAFVMLCWNTNYLFDVGFQLSFAAVLGIVSFYPLISRRLTTDIMVLGYIWNGFAVTIGALIGTLPLTIYYFHYFPLISVLSGVVVVFLATLILGTGVLYFVTILFSAVISDALAFVLNFFVSSLNQLVSVLHELNFGFIDDIGITLLSVALFYLFIISLHRWLSKQDKWSVYSTSFSFLGISLVYFLSHVNIAPKHEIVLYHDYKTDALEIFKGQKSWFLADAQKTKDESGFLNKNLRIQNKTHNSIFIHRDSSYLDEQVFYRNGILKHEDLEMLFIDTGKKRSFPSSVHWDYIVLTDNPDISIVELGEKLKFDTLILAASNWSSKIKGWKAEAHALGMKTIDIKNTGAHTIYLDQ